MTELFATQESKLTFPETTQQVVDILEGVTVHTSNSFEQVKDVINTFQHCCRPIGDSRLTSLVAVSLYAISALPVKDSTAQCANRLISLMEAAMFDDAESRDLHREAGALYANSIMLVSMRGGINETAGLQTIVSLAAGTLSLSILPTKKEEIIKYVADVMDNRNRLEMKNYGSVSDMLTDVIRDIKPSLNGKERSDYAIKVVFGLVSLLELDDVTIKYEPMTEETEETDTPEYSQTDLLMEFNRIGMMLYRDHGTDALTAALKLVETNQLLAELGNPIACFKDEA